ncbi:MAG: UDP-glucose/GDP-mannose dehydrogenase family protein [Bacillota bacterium]
MYKVAVAGTGYVGLVTGVCLADIGHSVICVDINEAKINMLKRGEIPIYEPGLDELVKKNVGRGRLSFSTDLAEAVKASEVIFIGVGTPPGEDGSADLSQVEAAAVQIGASLNGYKVIVTKSTVPVGTGEMVRRIIKEKSGSEDFAVVSNPEFLREGSAVHDAMYPDRIVIGCSDKKAAELMMDLYKRINTEVLVTDIKSAELIKYASNAFLATKISFINEVANICEKVGADVNQVAKGMGLDTRIGNKFLNAGIGYGGSCFPKDTQALIKMAEEVDYDLKIVKAAEEVNKLQKLKIINKLEDVLGDLKGKTIAILGLAFKPNTDDMREAPSLVIIPELIERGAIIKAYDPVAVDEAKKCLGETINYCKSIDDAVKGAHAIALLTEWEEFKKIDFSCLGELVCNKIMVDGRNIFDREFLEGNGWTYRAIGRCIDV